MRGLVKGKRWLMLARWTNLAAGRQRPMNVVLNREREETCPLQERLDRLTNCRMRAKYATPPHKGGGVDWQRSNSIKTVRRNRTFPPVIALAGGFSAK